jgi:hypothetical protein
MRLIKGSAVRCAGVVVNSSGLICKGVIGSLAVTRPGPARASLSRLVSWIELWACPSACKIPLLARLRRNAARSRFHRTWLARRKNAYELCPLVSRRAVIRWNQTPDSAAPLPRLAERRAKPNTRMCMQWTWLWPTRLCKYSQVRRVRGTNHAPRRADGLSYFG